MFTGAREKVATWQQKRNGVDRKSLLENDTSRKVSLTNWEPLVPSQMQNDQAQRQEELKAQQSMSSAVVKPQGGLSSWTTFKSSNPFAEPEDNPFAQAATPGGGQQQRVDPFEGVGEQIEGKPSYPSASAQQALPAQQGRQQFSNDNPFARSPFPSAAPFQGQQQQAPNPFAAQQVYHQNNTTIRIQQTSTMVPQMPPGAMPHQQQPGVAQHDPFAFSSQPSSENPFAQVNAPPGQQSQQQIRSLSQDALSCFDPVPPPPLQRAVSEPQHPTQNTVGEVHNEGPHDNTWESMFGDMFTTPGGDEQKASTEEGEQREGEASPKKKSKKKKAKSSKKRSKKKRKKVVQPESSSEEQSSSPEEEEESPESEATPTPPPRPSKKAPKKKKSKKKKEKEAAKKEEEKPRVRTESLAELLRGTAMLKFPRRSGRRIPHFKWVQLTRSKTSIYLQWFSKKKSLKQTTINVADMDEVLQGKQSEVYQRHEQDTLSPAAFTIVYNNEYSLDLVAKSVDECNMWVKCLKELIKRAKQGQNMSILSKIWINGLDYLDRNRPARCLKGRNVVRANAPKKAHERKFNPRIHEQVLNELNKHRKACNKLATAVNSAEVRHHQSEHGNILKAVTDLEERLDELLVETRESMDTDISKRDVWRFGVDLGALEEKVKVLSNTKNFHLHP